MYNLYTYMYVNIVRNVQIVMYMYMYVRYSYNVTVPEILCTTLLYNVRTVNNGQ